MTKIRNHKEGPKNELICLSVGNDSVVPFFKQVIAPQALANLSIFLTGILLSKPYIIPAVNESPAPVVSIGFILNDSQKIVSFSE